MLPVTPIKSLRAALAGLALAATAPATATVTITFDNPAVSGPLNTQYSAQGITFAQSGPFSTARTYNDVRDPFDQRGFSGTAERGNPTVLFNTPVDNLSFDFVSLGHALIVFAFNDDNPALQIISEALPQGVVTTGTRSFNVNGIQGIRFVDIDQQIGISTLRFDIPGANTGPGPVPEPATWALMILGFGLIGGAMRSSIPNRQTKGAQA